MGVQNGDASALEPADRLGKDSQKTAPVFRDDVDFDTAAACLFGQSAVVEDKQREAKLVPSSQGPKQRGDLDFRPGPAVSGSHVTNGNLHPSAWLSQAAWGGPVSYVEWVPR